LDLAGFVRCDGCRKISGGRPAPALGAVQSETLKRARIDFLVREGRRVGGTWRDNNFPAFVSMCCSDIRVQIAANTMVAQIAPAEEIWGYIKRSRTTEPQQNSSASRGDERAVYNGRWHLETPRERLWRMICLRHRRYHKRWFPTMRGAERFAGVSFPRRTGIIACPMPASMGVIGKAAQRVRSRGAGLGGLRVTSSSGGAHHLGPHPRESTLDPPLGARAFGCDAFAYRRGSRRLWQFIQRIRPVAPRTRGAGRRWRASAGLPRLPQGPELEDEVMPDYNLG